MRVSVDAASWFHGESRKSNWIIDFKQCVNRLVVSG